jgi:Flp pilus assembly protein TadB
MSKPKSATRGEAMAPQSPNAPAETGEDNSGGQRMLAMPTCPMAETCKGMVEKPMPKFLLPLPGLLFIAVGVLILLIPTLLVWFIAFASIAMGIMMLIFANFMSKMGERFRRMHP